MENRVEKDEPLVSSRVVGRRETYYLVSETELDQQRTHTIVGEIFLVVASVALSVGFGSNPNQVAFISMGLLALAIAIYFYYLRFNFIRSLNFRELISENDDATSTVTRLKRPINALRRR